MFFYIVWYQIINFCKNLEKQWLSYSEWKPYTWLILLLNWFSVLWSYVLFVDQSRSAKTPCKINNKSIDEWGKLFSALHNVHLTYIAWGSRGNWAIRLNILSWTTIVAHNRDWLEIFQNSIRTHAKISLLGFRFIYKMFHKKFHLWHVGSPLQIYGATYTQVCKCNMGPLLSMDQRKVEAIQRRTTKLITSLCESNYSTRLTELQLPSLNYWHQRGDMIYLYQIFNNLVDINIGDLFTLSLSWSWI